MSALSLEYDAPPGRFGILRAGAVPLVVALVLGLAAVAVDAASGGSYRNILVVFFINAVLAVGLQAFVGLTGVMSFGHIAFMAVGAYTTGVLTVPAAAKSALLPDLPFGLVNVELPFILGAAIGAVAATALALLVGPILMRLSGAAASAASIGLLVIVTELISNAASITRGTQTFSGVPKSTTFPLLIAVLVLAVACSAWMRFSRVGLRARTSGDDELSAQASGVYVTSSRIPPYLLSAAISGLGGALFAGFIGAFSPNSFSLARGVIVIVVVVLGGTGSITGVLLAAAAISVFGELTRQLEGGMQIFGLVTPALPSLSELALGLVLILVLMFRPSGFLGAAEPQFNVPK